MDRALAEVTSWCCDSGYGLTPNGRLSRLVGNGILKGKRYLIHDRDPLFTSEFLEVGGETGVASVKLPARSPNLNAYAERFVRTIKDSCMERLILFGEGSVRRAVAGFTVHHHTERNRQGLDNKLICPDPNLVREGGKVKRRERLG